MYFLDHPEIGPKSDLLSETYFGIISCATRSVIWHIKNCLFEFQKQVMTKKWGNWVIFGHGPKHRLKKVIYYPKLISESFLS